MSRSHCGRWHDFFVSHCCVAALSHHPKRQGCVTTYCPLRIKINGKNSKSNCIQLHLEWNNQLFNPHWLHIIYNKEVCKAHCLQTSSRNLLLKALPARLRPTCGFIPFCFPESSIQIAMMLCQGGLIRIDLLRYKHRSSAKRRRI